MWELDCEESWAPKNWCFWAVVLDKTLESSLDCKKIQPVHPKGDQSWVYIGRNDAEAETPILWLPHVKSWVIGKDSDAGRDWGQEEKGTTEDEMAGWHHGLDGHEFEWTLGVGDGQGGLACCSSWGCQESVKPSNHLILCHLLLLSPSFLPSIRVFSNESVLHIRWPKYWSFHFTISPSNEYSGLISFRIDCFNFLSV